MNECLGLDGCPSNGTATFYVCEFVGSCGGDINMDYACNDWTENIWAIWGWSLGLLLVF